MNVKLIDYKILGIYRRGILSIVEISFIGSRYFCYKYFMENNVKVVCLIWGLLL